ncbi:MAG: aminopeptidase [Deltaproteobacteria bacterium]|nr:aminopeptidase [Deltaproteobacteria bacterium]
MTKGCGALAALVAATLACSTDTAWLVEQGVGQAEVLLSARPIGPLVRDARVPAKVKRRLALAVAARTFAKEELGLDVGFQYRSAVFLDAPAVVYVVSAAPRTSLEPYAWSYPVLGELPYRGFFSIDDAEQAAADLAARGLDVDVRPVTTFSLLGAAPDPVLSTMLFSSDELALVETVIHELAHATLFVPGQAAFNEGFATFIGREGRRRFVLKHWGAGSAIRTRMDSRDRDDEAYLRGVGALAFDLRVLFAQGGSVREAELLARKDRIFVEHQRHWEEEVAPTLTSLRYRRAHLPNNNAELSSYGIYTLRRRVYQEAFESCREEMRCLLALLRRAAREPDPELALTETVHRGGAEVFLP